MTLTDPRALDYLERIALSLADIADALTRNRAARPADLTPPDPNRCEPGCGRPSLHGGDCETRPDALDDMLMAELAPRYCGAPKPGYHCTSGAHNDGMPHIWAPNEETWHSNRSGTVTHMGHGASCGHGPIHSDKLRCDWPDHG